MSLPLLRLISRAATNQIAYFLSPSLNFITEYLQPRPVGAIYRLTTYPTGNVNAAQLTPAETTAVSAYWNKVRPELNDLVRDVKLGALNVRQTAGLWARTANNDGVLLQQSDHPTEADPLFELALKLNPDNVAAAVNLRVNTALRGHLAITDDVRKPMSGKSVSSILTEHGLLDEPKALFAIARGANIADPSLPRAAAIRFLRALQLDPTYTSAAFGYISACLNAQEPGLALTAIRELRAKEKLEPDSLEKLLRLEFGANIIRGDTAAAEQLLLQARVEQPKSAVPLQLLSELYLEKKRYAEALQQLNLWQALKVGGEDIPLRRVVVYMSQQQFDPALPLLDKILRDQPENEIARANRAICLLQLNRFDDSRRDYEVLLKKYPDRYSLHYGLGELAEKKKDPSEARKHFQRYLELAPPNTTEYTNVFARVRQLKGGN
jgi:tetratricopeptide (TPR) repeat protein